MKILSRYIAKEYGKVLFFSFSSVSAIYLIAHFLGKIDKFIEYHASPSLIGTLVLLKLPRIYYEVLPIAVLLATLITVSLLSRSNEITAMRSCGIGLLRLVLPIFAISLLLSFFSLLDGEWGVPYANQRSHYLYDVALKKRPPILALKKNRIWFRAGKNTFCNILKVDPEKHLLKNVTLLTFNNGFDLITRKDAERVTWDGKKWVTEKGTELGFSASGAIEQERHFEGAFPLNIPLEEIIDVEKSPKEMGYKELRDYIRILKRNGYATATYEVDLQAKLSYSMISLVMVFLGVPFALRINRRGGIAIGIGLSLAIGFFYWMAYSVGLSFGHAGLLPPFLAAWLINLLFGAAALYWTFRIRF